MDLLFPGRKQTLASPRARTLFLAGLAGVLLAMSYRQPANALYVLGGAALGALIVALIRRAERNALGGEKADQRVWREFPLLQKTQISSNTAIYRFALPTKDYTLGLPVGQHISLKAMLQLPDGSAKDIQRSYTPISSDKEKGYLDLLVKTYAAGLISRHLSLLDLSSHIQISGPKGQFRYAVNDYRFMLMIAGGTGITPMYQVLRHIVEYNLERIDNAKNHHQPEDLTRICLLYANVSEEDILLRLELDTLCKKSNGRVIIYYVLNNAPENWTGGVGFVSKEMIEAQLPQYVLDATVDQRAAMRDIKVLICGPPPMVKAMTGYTDALGFQKSSAISRAHDQVFKF